MPHLNKVISYINAQLATNVFGENRFQPQQFSGVCITIPAASAQGTEPVLADDFDDNKYVGIDDRFSLQVYHKNTGVVHQKDAKQHGDTNNRMISTYQMQMIIAARRKEIRLTPEELEMLFIKGIDSKIPNSEISPLKISRIAVTPVGTDFNAQQIWRDEYSREYELNPNQILFRLRYTVEMAYNKSCINLCCN